VGIFSLIGGGSIIGYPALLGHGVRWRRSKTVDRPKAERCFIHMHLHLRPRSEINGASNWLQAFRNRANLYRDAAQEHTRLGRRRLGEVASRV
jgi:hypothetical protein